MNYKIEHKVRDPQTGRLRKVKKDLDINNNPNVRQTFKIIYHLQKIHSTQKPNH